MAKLALVNATTWVGGHDLTTALNSVGLNVEAQELDCTTFGSTFREYVPGLKTVGSELAGYWDSPPDDQAYSNLGVMDRAVTMSVDGQAESVAYLYRAGQFTYTPFGAIGEVTPFTLTMMNSDRFGLVRGQVALTKGTVDGTGAVGSAVNLGAASGTQFLYAAVHVFTAGTTITLKVESDDAEEFTDPSDVTGATIGPVTAAGGFWMTRVAGPLTDTWYRLNATAVTGEFTAAAALAVQ